MKSKKYLYLVIAVLVVVLMVVLVGGKKSEPSQEEQFIASCALSGGSYVSATKTCVPPKTVVSTKPVPVKPDPSQTTITKPVVFTTPPTPQPGSYPIHVSRAGASVYYSPTTTVSDMIKVYNPPMNTSIASPLVVSGNARGPWFSEGTAPFLLTNSYGVIIARGTIRAQSNSMTNEWVPFIGTIPFPAQGSGTTGALVIKKANPSGASANDASIEILVSF